VGQNNLLVVGKSLGKQDFNDFHPVAHVEANKQVVEDEELEVGFVQIHERRSETDRKSELSELGFV
jgi:hypothetical protein